MDIKDDQDEINDSPIEQVRLMVPITDDSTLPVLTFRTWVLGPITCIFLAIATQFFAKRANMILITDACCTMLFLTAGKFMAATLPSRPIRVPGTQWTFSMNPGPFSIKEHILISIFANTGSDNPYSLSMITMLKAFYHKKINFWPSFLLVQTSQMIGYGFAGIFMKFLVESPYMWWPLLLLDVSFYRVLHETEERPKRGLSKLQFFVIVSVASFSYYVIPNYFFQSIMFLSPICWIWKRSITAQQIGSGLNGLGIGSFSLDWSTMTGFLWSPMALPMSTVINTMVGIILLLYIITPLAYWTNSYSAKRFPIYSTMLLDYNGQEYNVSRVLDNHLTLNENEYKNYSSIYMSIFLVYCQGFLFAAQVAAITHFVLFYGRDTWKQLKQALGYVHNGTMMKADIHNRMMKKYKSIPQYWFYFISISMIGLAVLNCILFEEQIQLPYWGVLFGCLLSFVLILPFGVLLATTGQSMDMFGFSEIIMGYIYPGKPLANYAFTTYGSMTLLHCSNFLYDFKLAHYMKIPLRSMFIIQISSALLSYSANLAALWWLLSSVENICDLSKLPEGSPWTCPGEHMLFSNSMIWGGIGPSRVFAPHGLYSKIYWFYVIGFFGPVIVWIFSRMYPKKKWIKLINVAVIFGAIIPAAGAVHYWSWFTIAIIFNIFIHKHYRGWWNRYNYTFANGMDFGNASMALLASATLNLFGIYGPNWWGLEVDDHCPLASCPTALGVEVHGCPTVY